MLEGTLFLQTLFFLSSGPINPLTWMAAALGRTWKRFATAFSRIQVPETHVEIWAFSCVIWTDAAKRKSDKSIVCQVLLLFQGLCKGTFLVYLLLLKTHPLGGHYKWQCDALKQRQWATWPTSDVNPALSEGVDELKRRGPGQPESF